MWDALGGELRLSTKLPDLRRWPYLMNLIVRKAAKRVAEDSDMICGMMGDRAAEDAGKSVFCFRLLWK